MKNVAITLDKNYSIHAAVMLYSLLSNNNPSDIHVHILLDFRNILYKIPILNVLKKKKCWYTFHLIQEKDIPFAKDLIINEHITIAAYFRLFLPSILKKEDRVLYLDGDMIVEGNIDELYNTDLQEHTLSAVYYTNEERISTLGLTHGYFNSGVMLLNLDYLRTHQYELKFGTFIKTHPDKIKYWDQDVLNAVTEGSVIPVETKWNFLCTNADMQTQPFVIHYAGTHKPWSIYYDKRFKENYFKYLHKDKFLYLLSRFFSFSDFIKTRFRRFFKMITGKILKKL